MTIRDRIKELEDLQTTLSKVQQKYKELNIGIKSMATFENVFGSSVANSVNSFEVRLKALNTVVKDLSASYKEFTTTYGGKLQGDLGAAKQIKDMIAAGDLVETLIKRRNNLLLQVRHPKNAPGGVGGQLYAQSTMSANELDRLEIARTLMKELNTSFTALQSHTEVKILKQGEREELGKARDLLNEITKDIGIGDIREINAAKRHLEAFEKVGISTTETVGELREQFSAIARIIDNYPEIGGLQAKANAARTSALNAAAGGKWSFTTSGKPKAVPAQQDDEDQFGVQLGQLWSGTAEGVARLARDYDQADLTAMFTDIEASLKVVVNGMHGADAQVTITGKKFIDGAKKLIVYYDAVTQLGDGMARLEKQQATFDFATAAPEIVSPQLPTAKLKATGDSSILGITPSDFTGVLGVYRELQVKSLDLQQTLASTGQTLGKEFKVNADEAEIAVDHLSGTARIAIPWIQELGDGAQRSGQLIKNFKVDLEQGTVSKELSPLEGSKQFFQSTKAQDDYVKNLTATLDKLGLSTDQVTRAFYDGNAGLIRITAQGEIATGVVKQLNIAFNEQGKIVQDTSNRYDGFFAALQKNFVRVARWAIATTVIYGAINQLRQIPAAIAEIDQATARLAAISGVSSEAVDAYFNKTIDAAKRFGIELQEAIPAAEFALQAAGGSDQEDALALLSSSMLLAKITGDDLKTSVDILSAALSQFNLKVNEGEKLIGKWLAINRVYSVSLTDLARGYATAGTLAQDFIGTSDKALDSFNALIAITARETALSSTQLGNFLKTVLTSYSSTEVQDILSQYGIAAKDSSGELRNFRDVLYEVYLATTQFDARTSGALTNISRVLGGGGSRQTARVSALISGLGDLSAAEQVSAAAKEATSANYLEFVTTLTDNLKDKFQELNLEVSKFLKSFGDSDILPFLTQVTTAMTNIVSLTENMSDKVGSLIVRIGSVLLLSTQLSKMKFLGGIGGAVLGLGATKGVSPAGKASTFGGIGSLLPGMSGQTMGIALAASIISGLIEGFSAEENGIVAGLTNGIVTLGAALVGGAAFGPVGALMGASLAGFLIEGYKEAIKEADLVSALLEKVSKGELHEGSLPGEVVGAIGTDRNDLARAAATMAGIGRTQMPAFGMEAILGSVEYGKPGLLGDIEYKGDDERLLAAIEFYKALVAIIKDGEAAAEAEERAVQENLDSVERKSLGRQETIKKTFVGGGAGQAINTELLARKESTRRRLLTEALAGDLSKSEFGNIIDRWEGSTNTAIQAWDALSSTFRKTGKDFYDIVELFALIPEEWAGSLVDLINEINNLQSQIDLAREAGEDFTEAQDKQNEKIAEAVEIYEALNQQRLESQGAFDLPSFQDRRDDTQATVLEDASIGRIKQEQAARFNYAANESFYKEQGLDSFQAYYEGYVSRLPDLYIATKDGMLILKDLASEWNNIGATFGDELRKGMEESFNVRRLKDIDPSQMGEIEAANRYWVNYLANIRGQTSEEYIQEEGVDMNLILGENNVFNKILSTNEAMNFVLQDILDTEKKQLEGMWNIPEGGTFWVPITSLFYQQGQGGGYPALPPIQDTRVGEGGGVSDFITKEGGNLANLSDIEGFLAIFKKFIIDPTRSIDPSIGREMRGEPFEKRSPYAENPQQVVSDTMTATLKLLGLKGGLQDFKMYLPNQMREYGEEGRGKYPGIPGQGFDSLRGTGPQALNVSVTVPEPQSIKVEAVVHSSLYLDGKIIAAAVKREMMTELGRVTYNRRSVIPVSIGV